MSSKLFRTAQVLRRTLRPIGIERADFLKPVYYRFKSFLKQPTAEVDGFHFHLDRGDSLDLSLSEDYERFERSLLGRWLEKGETVLDIGAHIGLFSLILSRLVGPEGRVFAFEPCPETRRLLERNVRENGASNVTVVPYAVANRSGKASLYLNPENSGDHRLFPKQEATISLEIETIRLDDYPELEEIPIDFIKMDIQGAEYQALLGMESLLNRSPRVRLLLEFWPRGLQRAGTDPLDLLGFLHERGFRLYRLNEEREELEKIHEERSEVWLERLVEGFGNNPERHTNLFAERR